MYADERTEDTKFGIDFQNTIIYNYLALDTLQMSSRRFASPIHERSHAMEHSAELSERDETLAHGYYSGVAALTMPQVSIVPFDYSLRPRTLWQQLAITFGDQLSRELPEQHRLLVKQGVAQSKDDLALAARMASVQQDALAS
jgi:hypothetical protein